ncbi:hypothetical protein D047_5071A, partial [Vibrio parahaemolyticus VPTS-2010_2]
MPAPLNAALGFKE